MKKILPLFLFCITVTLSFGQQKFSRIVPPQFPGGKTAMDQFIKENMNYPPSAEELEKEGSVRLQIKVDTLGNIFEVLTGDADEFGFQDEALRLLEMMPNWEPATKNGSPIATKYTFFIDFKLSHNSGPARKFEKMPSFPGGNRALRDFIIKDLKYPENIADSSLAGSVVIQVRVGEGGDIIAKKVVKTLGQEFTKEAYRTIENMPLWEPGIADGIPTAMWYSIPFSFTTNEAEKEASGLEVTFQDKDELIEAKKNKKNKKAKKEKAKEQEPERKDEEVESPEPKEEIVVAQKKTYVKRDSLILLERPPLRVVDTTYKQSPTYVAPQFPGGENAFSEYLEGTMIYPKKARKKGLEGIVKVKFKVSEKGLILNPVILQSQGRPLDQEVLRLLKYMPNWIPAYNEGEPIPDDVTLPVTFVLPKKR